MKYNYVRFWGMTLGIMSTLIAQAQLSAGSQGLFVKTGTVMSVDGLTLTPSADMSFANNAITLSHEPVPSSSSGNGSIQRVYLFAQPFGYLGEAGIRYLSAELNGNTAAQLALMYKSSTTGQYGLANLNTISAENLYVRGATTGTTPVSFTAFTAVNSGVALPVNFGSLTAFVKNNKLRVEWETLIETGNSHFEIEGSANGQDFTRIGEVKSKAESGNSNSPLQYSWEAGIEVLAGVSWLMGLMALALAMATARYRKRVGVAAVLLACSMFYMSCSKYTDVSQATPQKYFIRIAQVDKDGAVKYSKTVQVDFSFGNF